MYFKRILVYLFFTSKKKKKKRKISTKESVIPELSLHRFPTNPFVLMDD